MHGLVSKWDGDWFGNGLDLCADQWSGSFHPLYLYFPPDGKRQSDLIYVAFALLIHGMKADEWNRKIVSNQFIINDHFYSQSPSDQQFSKIQH